MVRGGQILLRPAKAARAKEQLDGIEQCRFVAESEMMARDRGLIPSAPWQ
jgi:hypothetical protein